jgi:hypothetical protein
VYYDIYEYDMLPMGFDGSLEEYRSIMSSEIYNPLDKPSRVEYNQNNKRTKLRMHPMSDFI